jgi:hypothetical protein
MLPRRILPLASRGYCCAHLTNKLFSEQRKVALQDKVSKLQRTRPASTTRGVVDEDKVGLLKRSAVLVPLVMVDNKPR